METPKPTTQKIIPLESMRGLAGLIVLLFHRFDNWPRLFPMALISTLFSWLMIYYGLYSYVEAAQITKASWMARFSTS